MFFWIVAIPFFLIIAMFTIFRLPTNTLKDSDEIQDHAMAFRMSIQHDASVRALEDYIGDNPLSLTAFSSGEYDFDSIDAQNIQQHYTPPNYIFDIDNIITYVRCFDSARALTDCKTAEDIHIITAAAVPSGSTMSARWFEDTNASSLGAQLQKFSGNFPFRPKGMPIPVKPVQGATETDADFAIRLNTYETNKAEYVKLKRNYYKLGDNKPRPVTAVGVVRSYPFDDSNTGDYRVIVKSFKNIGGVMTPEILGIPDDLEFDFLGEAIIHTASGICPSSPYSPQEIIEGCNANPTMTNEYCQLGYKCKINDSCDSVNSHAPDIPAGTPVYLTRNSTDNPYAVNLIKTGTTVATWTNLRTSNYPAQIAQLGTYNISCPGIYQITLKGAGTGLAHGGIVVGTKSLPYGTALTFKVAGTSTRLTGVWGGVGLGMQENGSYALVAGGASTHADCGSGWLGGCTSSAAAYGWSFADNGRATSASCNNAYSLPGTTSCSSNADGGARWPNGNRLARGGSGLCINDFNCIYATGRSAEWNGSAWLYGCQNSGNADTYGSATVKYIGNNLYPGKLVYEAKNISTLTKLALPIAPIGRYVTSEAGKYKVTIMGEGGCCASARPYAAGGIVTASGMFAKGEILTFKRIKGGYENSTAYGGAGVAFWDTFDTTGVPRLVAGGSLGTHSGGGGLIGGINPSSSSRYGWSWNGVQGNYNAYCSSTTCAGGAQGGCYSGSPIYAGGTGTVTCPDGYVCTITPGGNYTNLTASNYFAADHGNWWTNTLTGGKGYASVIYCGPNASSTCP